MPRNVIRFQPAKMGQAHGFPLCFIALTQHVAVAALELPLVIEEKPLPALTGGLLNEFGCRHSDFGSC